MSKSHPSSVTAEEAVARMVNMDYIPSGFTLEDMLSAFKEEAEVEHHNAKIDRLPDAQIESLEVRMEACEARRSLAKLLLEDLQNEVRNPELFFLKTVPASPVTRWRACQIGRRLNMVSAFQNGHLALLILQQVGTRQKASHGRT